jgi:hypothetical protein
MLRKQKRSVARVIHHGHNSGMVVDDPTAQGVVGRSRTGDASWGSPRHGWRVDGPIEMPVGVSLLVDGGQEPAPEPRLPPAIKAARSIGPWPIPFRQITPRGTGAEEPQDTVKDTAVVNGWATCFRLLWGQER